MAAKRKRPNELTDADVAKLPLTTRPGDRYSRQDTECRGLEIRVTHRTRTYAVQTRTPGSSRPVRRTIGRADEISIADARRKAAAWRAEIKRGGDPKIEEERRRLAEQRRRANTFAAVAEDFIAEKLPKERSGEAVEREIRGNLTPAWGGRPIADITDDEIAALIKIKARRAPVQARNLLATVKRLFQWAIDQRAYGIKTSPAAGLKPASLCGEKVNRDRTLSDDELFALWRATGRMRYPHGPAYRLLLLSGLRLNEVADASWSEFDPAIPRALRHRKRGEAVDWQALPERQHLWVIPKERMKAKNSRARPHSVPLTRQILRILTELPQFDRGKFVFSTTFGEKPAWLGDKIKQNLDTRMLRTLRALAKLRGDNAAIVELAPWKNHDIRRTVRTKLSGLKIAEEVREAVLAHVRPGIKGVYDKYEYFDEKREALEAWGNCLLSIAEEKPSNVVPMQARAIAQS
jgi:integrase